MRIYYDKKNNEITIIGTQKELPSVNFVLDRGKGRHEDIFGGELPRYRYHWANVNEGYSTNIDKVDVNPKDRVYLIKRTVKKTRV